MNEDVKDIEIIASSKRGKDLLVKITFDDGDIFEGWLHNRTFYRYGGEEE